MPLIGFSELVNRVTIILELKMLPLRDLDYWVRERSWGSGPAEFLSHWVCSEKDSFPTNLP